MKIRLPVSNKKHSQVLADIERANADIFTTELSKRRTAVQLVSKSEMLAEALGNYADQRVKTNNLQQQYDSLCELHSKRIRIGSIVVDPIEMTARLRVIEPTIRVEFDGKRLFIYADRVLTDPEFNQLEGMLKVRIDKT